MQRVLVPHDISDERPTGCRLHEFSGCTMGTTWSVRLAAQTTPPGLLSDIQRELDAVVGEMSHWLPSSDLCRFNRAESGSWHLLPPAFFSVLSYALAVAADSDGAYDPAAGTLVNLWGFGPLDRDRDSGQAVPPLHTVKTLAAGAAWRRILLDRATCRAFQPGGAVLDFSSIAKGYGVDSVARYLERQGIRHYLVEVGGELRGAGMKPDGQPWWVMLEQPAADVDQCLLALHGLAVATSGDYRRYFEQGGSRYSHTLDPRTGFPISNGVAAVSVIHRDCMTADAWSTALTVMGAEQGLRLAEARGLAARFLVRSEGRLIEHASSRFLEMLQ
jgi:thiamine biosynthesis lipoprotein